MIADTETATVRTGKTAADPHRMFHIEILITVFMSVEIRTIGQGQIFDIDSFRRIAEPLSIFLIGKIEDISIAF
jgi:hypothetical protein